MVTPFFNNVELNGGTFIAESNNLFASDNMLTGSGTVQLPGTSVSFGTLDSSQTSTIFWHGTTSAGINLNAKTSLSGTWTFGGNVVINGNGNVLDLSNLVKLTIR